MGKGEMGGAWEKQHVTHTTGTRTNPSTKRALCPQYHGGQTLEIFESLATGDRSTHFPCWWEAGRPGEWMLSNERCGVLHCHITKTSRSVCFFPRMVGSSNTATEPGQEQRWGYASEVTFGSHQICSLPVLNGSLNWQREIPQAEYYSQAKPSLEELQEAF